MLDAAERVCDYAYAKESYTHTVSYVAQECLFTQQSLVISVSHPTWKEAEG